MKETNSIKLKPVLFVQGKYNYHRQNLLQQNLLLKALQVTTDVKELRKMIGVKTVAEVYRTLDKIAIRKEYHEALLRNNIDLDTIVGGIKEICNNKEESGATRLKGWQSLLKSLGLDNYKDVEKESKNSWEDLVSSTQDLLDKDKKKQLTTSEDYEVLLPEMPEEEKRKEEEETELGKSLYEN